MGQEEVPSMSIRLSICQLTTNCMPLSRIKWEIYSYKEECFVSFIDVRSLFFIVLGWIYETIQHLCIHHLFLWSDLNFLQNSQWIIYLSQLPIFLSFHSIIYIYFSCSKLNSFIGSISGFIRIFWYLFTVRFSLILAHIYSFPFVEVAVV